LGHKNRESNALQVLSHKGVYVISSILVLERPYNSQQINFLTRMKIRLFVCWISLNPIQDLFVICCGDPTFWGRQQAVGTSKIQSPENSIKWININQVVSLKVGFDALRLSHSKTFYDMTILSETSGTESIYHSLNP